MKKRCIILILAAMLLSSGCNTQTSDNSPIADGATTTKKILKYQKVLSKSETERSKNVKILHILTSPNQLKQLAGTTTSNI